LSSQTGTPSDNLDLTRLASQATNTRPPATASSTPQPTPRPTRPIALDGTSEPNLTLIAPTTETVIGPAQETADAVATVLETSDSGDEPTDAPTMTASSTPLVIAAAPLLIRSEVSGEVIGDGTIRVYAPSSVGPSQTVRVELELNLDNLYITPTPPGSQATPVPRSTQVSSPGGATPTPYLPVITDQGLPVYQRMGATLLCSAGSFSGCDGQRDQAQAKLITSRTTAWSWILRPAQDISGAQDLRIEMWIVQPNLDGALEYLDVPDAQYRFAIEVNTGGGLSPVWIALLGAGVALFGGLFAVWRSRSSPSPAVTPARRTALKTPMVFISYRRGSTWGQARSVEQSLRKRGADVFIDIDDINEGKFVETIEKAIADCDFFLPVLAPGTLESVWVRREIAHAIQRKKTIVPLLIDGFKLDAALLPDDIQEIASHNAITVLPEFYEEAMDRLAKRFLRLE
jgi:hypothetical protein